MNEEKQVSVIGILVLASVYLFIWPICALMLSGSLLYLVMKAIPNCTETSCPIARNLLDNLNPVGVVSIAILVLVVFAVSLYSRKIENKFARFLLNVHKYACLIAPGFIGGEGFGLPAPFLVGVVASAFNVKSLLGHFMYFPLIWLAIFLTLLLFRVMFSLKTSTPA